MTSATELTTSLLDTWATDPAGPVALHMKQQLVPVEGAKGIVFPPTYADIGYNVDEFADGTKVATIDSVGSQANRMEPLFKAADPGQAVNPLAKLIPQIAIVLRTEGKGKEEHKDPPISLLDLAHRSADAVVRSCPGLSELIKGAFKDLQTGNAAPLCTLAPTSLVFGVWDSRGESGQKRPRLVRAVIRAWDVEKLHSAAQFNSVWKRLDEDQKAELEAQAKESKVKLSVQGFADAPSTTRDDGSRVLGGIRANGRIEREVTINLVALRGLKGPSEKESADLRRYLLGLSLLAATADIDLFLREGCNLRFAEDDAWVEVPRRGEPRSVAIAGPGSRKLIGEYASAAAKPFQDKWPKKLEYTFDLKSARQLIKAAAKKKAGDSEKS